MNILAAAWERRALILAVAVVFLLALCRRQQEALRARPAVEVRTEVKTVRVAGPVHIVKQIVEKPGAERVVTITVDRAPVTTTSDRDVERKETPACAPARRLYVGAGIDSVAAWQKPYLRGGGMVFDGMLGVGGTINPWAKRVGLEAAYHW